MPIVLRPRAAIAVGRRPRARMLHRDGRVADREHVYAFVNVTRVTIAKAAATVCRGGRPRHQVSVSEAT